MFDIFSTVLVRPWPPNNALQETFGVAPVFASAKAGVASNVAEGGVCAAAWSRL